MAIVTIHAVAPRRSSHKRLVMQVEAIYCSGWSIACLAPRSSDEKDSSSDEPNKSGDVITEKHDDHS